LTQLLIPVIHYNITAHLFWINDFITIKLDRKNISIHASHNPITSKFGPYCVFALLIVREKIHNTGFMMTLLQIKMIKKFHMSEALYNMIFRILNEKIAH
jgi:hypothetical protein